MDLQLTNKLGEVTKAYERVVEGKVRFRAVLVN
jgi:D-arabinose 1-dehydrogenase-like Zn-dependent alcohol dehydrogenase